MGLRSGANTLHEHRSGRLRSPSSAASRSRSTIAENAIKVKLGIRTKPTESCRRGPDAELLLGLRSVMATHASTLDVAAHQSTTIKVWQQKPGQKNKETGYYAVTEHRPNRPAD